MKGLLRSKLVLSLVATIMIAAAVVTALSGPITHSFAASRSSHNIAYVNYDDSGFTGGAIPSGNIFVDAVVGGPAPTSSPTDSVTYNGMTFTPLARSAISTSSLAPFDTLILFEVCDIATSFTTAQHDAINSFLAAGNKILLYDGDRCAVTQSGDANYSWFTFPFSTSNPGPQGASGTLTVVENSTLTQGLSSDPFNSDELGDANTATTADPHWFAAAKTTNALGNNGYFLAYARNKGLIIYDGADHWFTFGPTKSLTDLFLNELNQVYDPDNLPGTTPLASKPLVVFIAGIDTHEPNFKLNHIDNAVDTFGSTLNTFKSIFGTKNADYLQFSYTGSTTTGDPLAYGCGATFNNTIAHDVSLLSDQIGKAVKANHDTDIYLVGHSLGGVIAFTYMAFLEEQNILKESLPFGVSLPTGTHLRAVITMDSPIGGTADGDYIISEGVFTTPLPKFILQTRCTDLRFFQHLESPSELVKVYHSAAVATTPDDTDPLGAESSVLVLRSAKVTLPSPLPSNQALAEAAQNDLGTSFLSIGNDNDFIWNPQPCIGPIKATLVGGLIATGHPFLADIVELLFKALGTIPNFRDTQWLEYEGKGLYGVTFHEGHNCLLSIVNDLNHGLVFTNPGVQKGLFEFLKPMSVSSGPTGGNPVPPLLIEPVQGTEVGP